MLDDTATAIVLLLFLSAAVERGVEVVLSALDGWQAPAQRRLLAVGLSAALSAAIAFGLELDLIGPLLSEEALTLTQARAATAIALAGGSGPAHELIRLIEEAKARLKAGSSGA
ncbi:MAG: hypothetical protein GEU75_03385 [Dehalococcoidia bacterium]|nr:hypothetical protein [Dehalococcoidia bacterium]